MRISALTFSSWSFFVSLSNACQVLDMQSERIGQLTFRALPHDVLPSEGTGRVAYMATEGENTYYLYHVLSDPVEEGIGRWYYLLVSGFNLYFNSSLQANR